ncbi:MAG: hypothetical protein K0S32_3391 [Bacteroidetes bacterium]|jgi:hypothetical protein|nr:hypothetical protein [Bacteroidota bacterium]
MLQDFNKILNREIQSVMTDQAARSQTFYGERNVLLKPDCITLYHPKHLPLRQLKLKR